MGEVCDKMFNLVKRHSGRLGRHGAKIELWFTAEDTDALEKELLEADPAMSAERFDALKQHGIRSWRAYHGFTAYWDAPDTALVIIG